MLISPSLKGVYEYPAVEYIPLYPRPLARGPLPADSREGEAPGLRIADSPAAWQEIIERYRLTTPALPPVDFPSDFAVVLLHCAPLECKYRDRRVTIVVSPDPGSLHAFSLTKSLFYRFGLEFILYSPDGKILMKSRRCF